MRIIPRLYTFHKGHDKTPLQVRRVCHFSMTGIEIGWTVIGIVVSVLITAGLAMVGYSPAEFRGARACFWLAAFLLGGMDMVWSYQTPHSIWWRVIVGGLIGATIFIALPEGLRWITKREKGAARVISTPNNPSPSSSPAPPEPPLVNPVPPATKENRPTPHKPGPKPPLNGTDGLLWSIKDNGRRDGFHQVILTIAVTKTLESPVIRIACDTRCSVAEYRFKNAGADVIPITLEVESHYDTPWVNIKFIDKRFDYGRTLDVFVTSPDKFTVTEVKLLH
jgi:hypothetical protein